MNTTRVAITRRMRALASAVTLALVTVGLAALAAPAAAAPAAAAPAPTTGTLTIRFATPSGSSIPLAGVGIGIYPLSDLDNEQEVKTDAMGEATFTDIDALTTYGAETEYMPPNGANTYTTGILHGIAIASGTTTTVAMPMTLGATITGTIVGASGSPAANKTVTATSPTGGFFAVESDATGTYSFVGLGTGIYRLDASMLPGHEGGEWKTRVSAQNGAFPASHVTLSTKFLHTTYDLFFDVTTLQSATAITGATVNVIDPSGAIVATEHTSTIRDSAQDARFDIPTGDYRIQMVTTAGAGLASQTLWLERGGATMTKYRSDALVVPVAYGAAGGEYLARIPAGGAD